MGSALPGKSSANTAVTLTRVALRLFQLGDLADAIGDLTGLGRANVDSLVRKAQAELADHAATEFTAVPLADRQWAEGVLRHAYVQVALDPARRVMGDSLIGPEAVALLAQEAMSAEDAREVIAASEDTRLA